MAKFGKILSAAALLLGASLSLDAQVYTSGDNPGGVKWWQVRTQNFRIIYPEGLDSLARVYASQLELWRKPVGQSIGFTPNGAYRRPMPVVLEAFKADNNGLVSWMPRRMELYTVPDAYGAGAIPSETELAIHEGRHVAQMQLGRTGIFKPLGWLTGQLSDGVASALYGGPALLEGDAVVAETALTAAGRGRTADFLEYMRVSFGSGDYRNYYRWRYGSVKRYTPDYYKVGYMTVAGMRYFYDAPDYTKRFYSRVSERKFALPMFNLQKTVKGVSGKKFRKAWMEVAQGYGEIWEQERVQRAPFIEAQALTQTPKQYVKYWGSTFAGGKIYAIRAGLYEPRTIVAIGEDGSEECLGAFAASTSALRYDPSLGRLWWSETVPDKRWGMQEASLIRYIELGDVPAAAVASNPDSPASEISAGGNSNGGSDKVGSGNPGRVKGKHSLKISGRYYNPAPDGQGRLAVTEYPLRGGSAAVLLSGSDGRVIGRYAAPDSMQVVECGWMNGRLYASAVTAQGFGIYDVEGGYKAVLDASPVKIKQLQTSADGSELLFVSDHSGVNELYSLSSDGRIVRLSSTPYGAADFVQLPDGRVAFTQPAVDGQMIYTAAQDYAQEVTDWVGTRHLDAVAEKLSEQERMLAAQQYGTDGGSETFGGKTGSRRGADDGVSENVIGRGAAGGEVEISEAMRYRKGLNAINIHSWVPLGFSYDSILEASYDEVYETVSPGASVLFQNTLGTLYGIAGYSLKSGTGSEWRHTAHASVTYSGLYPIIEASVDFNDRDIIRYGQQRITGMGKSLTSRTLSAPSLSGKVKVYVPLDFSGGGWYRGVIPQFSLSMTNDILDKSLARYRKVNVFGENSGYIRLLQGIDVGDRHFVSRAVASLRAYTMRPTASSAIYPRLGIGIEGGLAFRPGLTDLFSPAAFTYVYGYVPGLWKQQGVKLTAVVQKQLGDSPLAKEAYLVTAPRGFTSSQTQQYLMGRYSSQTKFTVDYALGSLPLDWVGLGPVAYVKSLDFALHGDLGFYSGSYTGVTPVQGTLYSAGADLTLRLGNLLWAPYECHLGVTWSYNGGSLWAPFSLFQNALPSRHYFGAIFSADL